jgi:hypothetical protein
MMTRPPTDRAAPPEPMDDDPVFGALDGAEQAALEAGVLARLDLTALPEPPLPAPPLDMARARARRRSGLRAGAGAAALAVALSAAAAWLLLPVAPELPAYALVMPPSDAALRAAEPRRTARYSAERALSFVFRPKTAVQGEAPRVLAFVREGGGFIRLTSHSQRDPSGAIRVELVPGALPGADGDVLELWFVLAPSALLRGDLDPANAPDGAQTFVERLQLAR